jgi:hypothetical protein
MMHLKCLEEQEQMKQKINKWKEIMKIGIQMNEIEIKDQWNKDLVSWKDKHTEAQQTPNS